MLIWPDCIACTIKMALGVGREVLADNTEVMGFLKKVLALDSVRGGNTGLTAPEIIAEIWPLLVQLAGTSDPLKHAKNKQNNVMMELYPGIKERIAASAEPFAEAVRIAIAGNAIDTMGDALSRGVEELLHEFSRYDLNRDDLKVFQARIQKARKILYFTDNCGEIVLDRTLLEVIAELYAKRLTVVTRKMPVMNDATMAEAIAVGLDQVADLTENDIDTPMAGTLLRLASPRLRALVEEADLLIIKGGGNYDTLTEEESIKGKATFLFQAKCHPFSARHTVPIGSLVIYNC
jgi:uncharacterized protein with ATP-grasp and redox domains